MKKRNLAVLSLLSILSLLTGCNTEKDSSSVVESESSSFVLEQEEVGLSSLTSKLLASATLENEEFNISKYSNTTTRGDLVTSTVDETWERYSGLSASFKGDLTYKVKSEGTEEITSNSYQGLSCAKDNIYYYIIDYEKDNLFSEWMDTASKLDIVSEGSEDEEGSTYLLESSLQSQLSKQVSLYTYNFFVGDILNNSYLQSNLPNVKVTTYEDHIEYELNECSYSYQEDSYTNSQSYTGKVSFDFNGRILKSDFTSVTSTTDEDKNSYVIDSNTSYEVSYQDRKAAPSNLLNPDDYFLSTINSIRPYYYDDHYDKTYADLNSVPYKKYIGFEAYDYLPSKAVNLEMTPISSSDESIIKVSGDKFETVGFGTCKIVCKSATGIEMEVEITVPKESASEIYYYDIYANVEYMEEDNSIRKMYANTTYTNICTKIKPSGTSLDDIDVKVDVNNVVTITKDSVDEENDLITWKYEFKDISEEKYINVTFYSKSNKEVSTTIKYYVGSKLSDEEMINKLSTNTYKWTNLYSSSQYAILEFTSSTGKITYYGCEDEIVISEFTYTYSNGVLSITFTGTPYVEYNEFEITLDGTKITLSIDGITSRHTYEIVKE